MKNFIFCSVLAVIVSFADIAVGETDLFVSRGGNDSSNGTKQYPLKTLSGAKSRAIALFKRGEKQININFKEGIYFFADTVYFQNGEIPADAKLAIRAQNNAKVIFHGGVRIPVSKFKEVKDASILAKLPPEKPDGKLYFLNLKENGLQNCGEVVGRGFFNNKVSQMEAFLDSSPMHLSRFPNSEYEFLEFGEVKAQNAQGVRFEYDSDRPSRWINAKKAWLYGRISRGWCDTSIPLLGVDTQNKTIHTRGANIIPGKSYFAKYPEKAPGYNPALDIRGFSAINLLEEADKHGEYFIDTAADKFYAVIDEPSKYKFADFSLLETPLVVFENVGNISVEGISFAYSRGNGALLCRVNNIKFENCEFFNLGLAGISMEQSLEKDREKLLRRCPQDMIRPQSTGSSGISILSCKFYDLGDGGALIMGGDIAKIERGNNLVADCTFERVCRLNKSYAAAVRLYGCGNTVEHCRISDLPHEAIAHNGIECTIRRNYIENVCNFSDDMGAIYGGANPFDRGTMIQENFFNNIQPKVGTTEISAVFIDDGNGGVTVRENLICRTGTTRRPALFIHGGRGNYFERNVFLDCPTIARCDFWDDKNFVKKANASRKNYREKMGGDDSALLKKYPDLEKVFTDGNLLNYITGNRVFRTGGVFKGVFFMTANKELVPSADVPKNIEWTLDSIKKYFGDDGIVKRLVALKYGPRTKK